jgi:hypothetical protein
MIPDSQATWELENAAATFHQPSVDKEKESASYRVSLGRTVLGAPAQSAQIEVSNVSPIVQGHLLGGGREKHATSELGENKEAEDCIRGVPQCRAKEASGRAGKRRKREGSM